MNTGKLKVHLSKNSLLLLVLSLFVMSSSLSAQKKKKPPAPKTPAKTIPKGGKKAVAPKETRKAETVSEVNPDPEEQIRKAKEEANQEKTNKQLMLDNKKSLGTVTVRFTYGFYDFDSKIVNTAQNEERSYSLYLPTQLYGAELAVRLGKDPEKFHSPEGAAFSYYRSNRGLFTDFELGFKTQKDDKPSVFDVKKTKNGQQSNSTIDLGPEYTSADFLSGTPTTNVKNLKDAGISPNFKSVSGKSAAQMTMVYLNSYYHFTPVNFIFNFFTSKFRWFDASIGPSLRIWYYTDYSDPMKAFEYNDDNTSATVMIVYRQYLQFHDRVRLRGHYYFPVATILARNFKSGALNEEEHILDAGVDIYLYNYLYMTVAYEAHWFKSNPYSGNRGVTTGFKDDAGYFDSNYQGFEKTSRDSQEIYVGIAIDVPLKL